MFAGPTISVIVKVIARLEPSRLDSLRCWEREMYVYNEPRWLTGLPAPLVAPELLATLELDRCIVLVLEDAGSDSLGLAEASSQWTMAEALGRFNATPGLSQPWFSRGALAAEQTVLDQHAVAPSDPIGIALRRIRSSGPDLLRGLNGLPQHVSHLDAFSRNVVIRPSTTSGAPDEVVLFDWATVGWAPLGADAGSLFALTLGYLDVETDAASEFEAVTFEGYVGGVRDIGPMVSTDELRFTFCAVAALRYGAMVANAHPMALSSPEAVAAIVGHPIDVVTNGWSVLAPRMVGLIDEAEHLLEHLEPSP